MGDDRAELTRYPATELARLIRTGEVSPVEVITAHLYRVADVNPRINALVQVAPDARDRARAAEAAVARGDELGPLHGVPFTVKDNMETAGVATTLGVPERAGVVPRHDATAVARMRAAGAILLGKTNCPPWGGGIETDNDLYGRTNNPHDPTRTAGGSSGGEAAIIAAHGSPCGLGTDSGGSLRLPAHFCGVAALKPTAGLVPVTGVIDDEGQIGALSDPRTQVGPLARRVADLAVMVRVIAGPDGRDAGIAPVTLGEPGAVPIHGLRVAVYDDAGTADAGTAAAGTVAAGTVAAGTAPVTPMPPTSQTRAAVRAAAGALADAGAVVSEARPPGDGYGLTVEIWRSYGSGVSSVDLYRLLRRWDAYRGEVLAFLNRFDVIVCPVYPVPAPPHGGTDDHGLRGALAFTTPYSLVGTPAVTVPLAYSPEGLPIGVQVVARPWRDDMALAAAACVEAVAT